jgi:transcriptional regulator with XRE-family HTH domain
MKTIGQQIREAREARGWSQKKVAELAGCLQQTVGRLENGDIQKSEDLPAICMVLGIRHPALAKNARYYETPMETQESIVVFYTDATPDGVFMTDTIGSERPRPQFLTNAPLTYGIYVPGGCCMAPIFRAGEILLINPHQAPRPGDRCLFRDAANPTSRIKLGELVGEDATTWSVKVIDADYQIEKSVFPHARLIVACLRG